MFLLEAGAPAEFCEKTAKVWLVLGRCVLILKIVVPLLLVIFAIIDLSKAVVASEDKAIAKSFNTLVHRFIAGLLVFLAPSIIIAFYNILLDANVSTRSGDYKKCLRCLFNVNGYGKDYCTEGVTWSGDKNKGSAPEDKVDPRTENQIDKPRPGQKNNNGDSGNDNNPRTPGEKTPIQTPEIN